jgi:hypothetical protein
MRYAYYIAYVVGCGKGKGRRIIDHGGPEKLLYSFFNLDIRLCEWSTPRSGRFIPGKETRYQLCRRLGGPPRPVWTDAENVASHRDSIPGSSGP